MAAGTDTSPHAGISSSSAERRQRTLRHLLAETPTFFKSPRQVSSAGTNLNRGVFDKRLYMRPQSCTAENRRKPLTASYPMSGTPSPMSRPSTSFSPRTPSERDRCLSTSGTDTDGESTARRPKTHRSYTASPLISENQQDVNRHVTEAWSRVKRESLRRRLSRMTPEQRDSFRLLHNPAFQAARLFRILKSTYPYTFQAGLARFYHAVRLVILVHRLRLAMTTLSRDKTTPTAAELRFHTLHHDEKILAFNKDMYARRTEDVAGSLGEAVLGVGGSILGGIGDVGGALVDGFFGTIGGAIQGVGDLFGGLFNRRLRNAILQHHVKRQVRSEPTCSQLQNEGGNACLLYASSCGNVCDTKYLEEQYCSPFQAAMADYQGSMQQNYWVTTMPTDNQNYAINQVLVDGSSFDATVGGYTSATVTATLFGETYAFSLDSPLTMFDMTQAGREIAQKALDHYKALHPAPTTKKI
uniref:Uncharacterized protein n=1 Tax=Branchiostoma floridae TaxID=7739 RepID=C3XS67_BRAFL|eukprot:XP_002613073.1 hypothetical protein BRAFLDRAFT_89955 [Branchiostoma floridae]